MRKSPKKSASIEIRLPHSIKEAFKAQCDAEKKEVLAAGSREGTSGGLHILGTERHESRRIDNQLRGRSGRQGDPGSSRFFLSLEDDLMRIFGAERITGIMERLGMVHVPTLDFAHPAHADDPALADTATYRIERP